MCIRDSMRGVNLAGAHLSTAGFTGLFDQTTIFSITNPATGANVGANLFGSGANMTGTPLQNADFRGANLAGVNLSNADLTNAQFNEFTIFSATPQGGGTQQAVNLLGTGADLSGINFNAIDFRGANLAGVNLSNANLANALFDHQTVFSAQNPATGQQIAANLSLSLIHI